MTASSLFSIILFSLQRLKLCKKLALFYLLPSCSSCKEQIIKNFLKMLFPMFSQLCGQDCRKGGSIFPLFLKRKRKKLKQNTAITFHVMNCSAKYDKISEKDNIFFLKLSRKFFISTLASMCNILILTLFCFNTPSYIFLVNLNLNIV